MAFRLIPRDEGFFDLFNIMAGHLVAAAHDLKEMFSRPAGMAQLAARIKGHEDSADHVVHDIMTRLDSSFITPLDREDIHGLAQQLDNAVDLINGTARRVLAFHIGESREPARRLSSLLAEQAEALQSAVKEIKDSRAVNTRTRVVKDLETQGDVIYQDAVSALFEGTPDPLSVMKWKEIYDKLEESLDRCQTVAIVLESISLKNS